MYLSPRFYNNHIIQFYNTCLTSLSSSLLFSLSLSYFLPLSFSFFYSILKQTLDFTSFYPQSLLCFIPIYIFALPYKICIKNMLLFLNLYNDLQLLSYQYMLNLFFVIPNISFKLDMNSIFYSTIFLYLLNLFYNPQFENHYSKPSTSKKDFVPSHAMINKFLAKEATDH